MGCLPVISCVVPTFNRKDFIETAICGLIEEKIRYYPNMEIIIIDGGSTDGTVEIIKRYGHELSHWISEPDHGPGEAFKKGIRMASGDYIRFIADDDLIIPGSTKKMMDLMMLHKDSDIVGGKIEAFDLRNGVLTPAPQPVPEGSITLKRLSAPDKNGFLFPETCLFKKRIFQDLGFWDDEQGPSCDFCFFLKALKHGRKVFISAEVFAHKYWHPDSTIRKKINSAFKSVAWGIWKYVGVWPALTYYCRVAFGPWLKQKREKTASDCARHAAKVKRSAWRILAWPFHQLNLHPFRLLKRLSGRKTKDFF